jgi:hypothetical protein
VADVATQTSPADGGSGRAARPGEPAPDEAVSAAPGEATARSRRAEALARLDEAWGTLPEESLDWARQRLGVSGGTASR